MGKVFQEERKPYSRPTGSRGYSSHGPRTHANAGGSQLNSPPMCSKCGRAHVGDSCPGMALTCFHCKEVGHVRRHCPKLLQSVNAVRGERPRSTGRVFTMSGAEVSGADGLIKEILRLEEIAEEAFKVTRNRSPTLTKVRMAERGRGTSQNVPKDLLAQMLEVLQGMNENLRSLNWSVAPGPGPLSQSGFAPNAAVEWVPGMGCSNMKADGVATSNPIPPRTSGLKETLNTEGARARCFPKSKSLVFYLLALGETGHVKRYCPMSRQSMNAMETGRPQSIGIVVTMCGVETSESDSLTRCGMYEEKVNESQRSYAPTGICRNHGYQGSKPTVPTEGVSTPMCKCGRLYYGSTCPGKGNGCFHYKEFGHIKRFCPKLDRRPNVMHAEEARDHGWMVTPSGAGTSGVDDPARGKSHGNSVDMRNDVLVGFNPGNGLAYQSWKFRLSERFSPERERITWEGEILGYTGRFSFERELPRLGEKWQTGAFDTVRFSLEREEESSGSRSSEPILAQARKSRLFKISDLTLSLKRGILAQARISLSQQASSRSSDPFLVWERLPEFPISKHCSSRLGEVLSLKRESGSMPRSSGLLPNFKEDKFGVLQSSPLIVIFVPENFIRPFSEIMSSPRL
ncbi:hypothetical protein Lal_00014117 [Lupinus albus]|nr:hypothetical protein Lal_00014117 [Lupinus albus]